MNKNGIFSSRDDTDYSASTQKRLSSDRILLLVLAGIAAFCDILTFIVALVAGYGAAQIVLLLLMLAADGLIIAGICFTNFRFKYSLAVWIGYVAVSFVLSLILLIGCSGGSGVQTMTTAATALVILSHLILWIVIGVCALADNFFPRKSYVKIVLCVVTGVAVLFTFAYSVFVADKGYYGQNEDNEIRVVSYVEDDELDGYKADGVIAGRGNKIMIPSTFNGKKVVSISADLLCDESIDNIVIEGTSQLAVRDYSPDKEISENLTVGVSREVIDDYRNDLISGEASGGIALADALYPADLSEDERFITFKYVKRVSEQVADHVLPTWIGKAGDSFDLMTYAEQNGITYIVNGDYTDDKCLHWSMLNNSGYVFKDLTFGGSQVKEIKVDENVFGAQVNFDKIYKIEILDDNDTLYEPDEDFKTMNIDGKTYAYRYVAESFANSLLGEISREGFNLSWKYKYNGISYYTDDFSATLSSGRVSYKNGMVQLSPEWQLKAPVIESVRSDKAGNSFVYGDGMTLSVKATAPVEGYTLSYEWTSDAADGLGTGKEISLSCVTPDNTGRYVVSVQASSPLTSLVSSAQSYVDVTVEKKSLRFAWTFPQNAVYDGTAKQAVCEIVQDDVVGDDALSFYTDAKAVVNAGTYTSKVTLLSGYNSSYYTIDKSSVFTYTIAKRPLTLVWQDSEFTYNGESQYPRVTSVTGAVAGEEEDVINSVTYGNYGKNAGSYNVKASLPSSGNYAIEEGASKAYSINKKQVSLVWQAYGTFVYNGYAQYPKAQSVTGVLDADMTAVLANLVYTGYGSDAGEYTVTAKLGAGSSNYLLTGEVQKSYTIDKKALTVNAVALDKVYDGKAGGDFSVTVEGLVGKDTVASLGTPVFAGDAAEATNAGSYTLSVSYAQNSVNKNYSMTYKDDTFVISPKAAVAEWSSVRVFDYDGEAHAPYILTEGKEYNGQVQITYKYYTSDGEEIAMPTQAGEYYVEAQLKSDNYTFSPMRIDFSIRIQEEAQR